MEMEPFLTKSKVLCPCEGSRSISEQAGVDKTRVATQVSQSTTLRPFDLTVDDRNDTLIIIIIIIIIIDDRNDTLENVRCLLEGHVRGRQQLIRWMCHDTCGQQRMV